MEAWSHSCVSELNKVPGAQVWTCATPFQQLRNLWQSPGMGKRPLGLGQVTLRMGEAVLVVVVDGYSNDLLPPEADLGCGELQIIGTSAGLAVVAISTSHQFLF